MPILIAVFWTILATALNMFAGFLRLCGVQTRFHIPWWLVFAPWIICAILGLFGWFVWWVFHWDWNAIRLDFAHVLLYFNVIHKMPTR